MSVRLKEDAEVDTDLVADLTEHEGAEMKATATVLKTPLHWKDHQKNEKCWKKEFHEHLHSSEAIQELRTRFFALKSQQRIINDLDVLISHTD